MGEANILDRIVEVKRREVARLPERPIAAGDLRAAVRARSPVSTSR